MALTDLEFAPAAINRLLGQANAGSNEPYVVVLAAVEALLYRYSAFISEGLNIRIARKTDLISNPIYRNAHQVQLLKIITGKETIIDLCRDVHRDMSGLPSGIATDQIELKWTTDNDGPDQGYKIIITDLKESSCKVSFEAPEKGFYAGVFKNAATHLFLLLNDSLRFPDEPISELEYLSNTDKILLEQFNYGPVNEKVRQPELLHSLFEETVRRLPDNIAIVDGARNITYKELDRQANQLMYLLTGKGIGKGSYVGILLKRSPEVYISMLAVLKSGAAYIPLDTTYPADRLNYILTDCKAGLLITAAGSGKIMDAPCDVLAFDERLYLQLENSTDINTRQALSISTDSPAYTIYTSGTTGRPKGVVISHAAVSNLVKAEEQLFAVNPSDKVLQGFSVAFDASVEEIWLAFRAGAALYPAPEEVMYSGQDLAQFIEENDITVLSTVPTMLSMMQPPLPSLRILILGGEYCPSELLKPWYQKRLRIVNTYGPTEATVIATYADFDPLKKITIGKPVVNYSTFILDANLMPVPLGVPGELCIGGPGLAIGYLNQDELTAEKFIKAKFPLSDAHYECIYRSGDLARFNEEGNIDFLGRIDSQVKLRGFRIELSEIESQLMQFDGIKNAVVAVKEDEHKVQRLVAYIILKDKKSVLDEEQCKTQLKTRLAPFMVPSVFVFLNEYPVLPSGKVDRKQLPIPSKEHLREKREIVLPASPTEVKLHRLWQQYFSSQEVSVTDDFFELGGHSLLASLIVSEIRKSADMARISVQDIYTYRTITCLAAYIDELSISIKKEPTRTKKHNIPERVSGAEYLATSILQALSYLVFMLVTALGLLSPYIVERLFPQVSVYNLIAYTLLGFFLALPVITLISIAAKWIFIGRIKEGHYPLWGWYYFRFWLVTRLINLTPMWLFSGTPFINWYFRMMGAKLGKRVYMGSDRVRMFDLLSIGDHSSISKEAHLLGYTVENGELIIGKVTIGKHCFVGTRAVVSAGATMKDRASLNELSLLEADATIPEGEIWEGSPAIKAGINTESIIEFPAHKYQMPFGLYLFVQYLAVTFVLSFPLALVVPFAMLYYLVDYYYGFHIAMIYTIPAAAAYTLSFCLLVALCKWIILGKVREEDFSIYSIRHARKWTVDTLMHMALITFKSIYATIFITSWLRLLGARVGKQAEVSTVNQMSTDLLKIGAGSFLADSVSVGSPEVRNGIMRLRNIRIGDKTFIGNSAVIGSGNKVGNDCLIGVLSTPPKHVESGMVNGTSWLGSPSMYLPRRQESEKFDDRLTFKPTTDLFFKRGFIEFFKITLPFAFTSCLFAVFYHIIVTLLYGQSLYHLLWLSPLVLTALMFAMPLIAVVFKWILMGRYKPSNKPLWSVFVWKNELVNSLCESMVYPLMVNILLGTPFAPFFFRLMGCKIGKRVYMETSEITEFDLVHIGDYACLNFLCTIQTHLFEDRVMKMSHLHIGKDCSIGPMAVVLYDSVMENGSSIDALSLVMKGEVIPQNTSWAGSPAKFVS